MNGKSIPRKVTLAAAGITAVSICDKGLPAIACITIITIVGILAQCWIDIKSDKQKGTEQ